jgi:hypothetical protein
MAKRKIDFDNLPSNNQTDDDEDIRPVLRGKVSSRKPRSGFASDVRDIFSALFEDVVLPNVRTIIGDFVTSLIEMMLWGDRGGGSGWGEPGGRQDYTRYSGRTRGVRRASPSRRTPTRAVRPTRSHVVEDIFFEDRQDAEIVLADMLDRVETYGWVSVGDLYALCGISTSHHDEQYGWYSLSRVRITRTRDGYIINLPRPAFR